MQQQRNVLLIALFLSKNKGGGAASRQTLLEYFKDKVKSDGSKNVELSLRIGSLFNPCHPLTKLQDTHIDSFYAVLKDQIREMLGAWKECDSDLDSSDKIFELDMQMMPVRQILIKALEDDVSGHSDTEVRELSLRLLTRIGMLTKNSETLLMVSYLQKKLQIDITHELKPFLDEAERFDQPEKDIVESDFNMQMLTLKNEVELLDSEDVSDQITMSYDAFTADKDFFYNYSELRGLTRAVKGSAGQWKRIDAINADCKGLKGVSMVMHDGKLLVRHSGLKDEPFTIFDKNTLKPAENATKFKHKEDESAKAKLQKLDWSEEKLPKEDEEDEEEKVEDEDAEIKKPRRRMGATPLASDGQHIYALSMQVKQEGKDDPLEYFKLSVEVFEIDSETNIVKHVKEFNLKKDDDSDWTWKPKKYNSDLGYFNHSQTACNGRVFVLNLPHRTYFFKVEGGQRFKLTEKRSKLQDHFQLVYEQDSNAFFGFQVGAFQGCQTKITLQGFERKKTEEEINAEKAPEVLKDGKEKISSEIDACSSDLKEIEKINIYEQLIEGRFDCNQILEQHTENLTKRKPSKVKNLHELSQAIVLTTMAQKADQFNIELEELGQNTVIGDDMEKYFRKENCIYLTKTMFKYLRVVHEDLLAQTAAGNVNVHMLTSLNSIIRL